MDAKRTMIEAYQHGLRFCLSGCGDPNCQSCEGAVTIEPDAGVDVPGTVLLDALACHQPTIAALLRIDVYRETRH
jgi:hypothetical protein